MLCSASLWTPALYALLLGSPWPKSALRFFSSQRWNFLFPPLAILISAQYSSCPPPGKGHSLTSPSSSCFRNVWKGACSGHATLWPLSHCPPPLNALAPKEWLLDGPILLVFPWNRLPCSLPGAARCCHRTSRALSLAAALTPRNAVSLGLGSRPAAEAAELKHLANLLLVQVVLNL